MNPRESVIQKICVEILLHYLRRRRETVIEAMLQLRPELVFYYNYEYIYYIKELDKKVRDFQKGVERKTIIPSNGMWRSIWHYEYHGIGIKLINVISGEFFDWDIGRPDRFTLGEVKLHFEWRYASGEDSLELEWYKKWVQAKNGNFDHILKLLKINKLIKECDPYVWTITGSAMELM